MLSGVGLNPKPSEVQALYIKHSHGSGLTAVPSPDSSLSSALLTASEPVEGDLTRLVGSAEFLCAVGRVANNVTEREGKKTAAER